jgi:hypothetical protein
MRPLVLVIGGAVLVLVALSTPAVLARQQSPVRFEYLRLAPYSGSMLVDGRVTMTVHVGLRACVAAAADWTCRDFPATQSGQDSSLRTALVTLGAEGWELVSSGYDAEGRTAENYMFMRQLR